MTQTSNNKLNRRDAIKLLGAAAGASVLANIPSKWSKPELASGVLPAHAQTSLTEIVCNTAHILDDYYTFRIFLIGVGILPPRGGVQMNWSVTLTGGATFQDALEPTSGSVYTSSNESNKGGAYFSGGFVNTPAGSGYIIHWSFNDPLEGTQSCDQVLTFH